MNPSSINDYLTEYQKALPGFPGKPEAGLSIFRQEAIEQFTKTGFPTKRDEDWKYTDLTELSEQRFSLSGKSNVKTLEKLEIAPLLWTLETAHALVFINGQYSAEYSSKRLTDDGIDVHNLEQILDTPDFNIKDIIQKNGASLDGFEALNAAFTHSGAYIHIRPHSQLEKPIQLLFVATEPDKQVMSQLRNVLVLGEGSRATVIEQFVNPEVSQPYLTNTADVIRLDQDAELRLVKIQQEGSNAYHIASTHVIQDAQSRFSAQVYSFGGQLAREDLIVRLNGEGAECDLTGLFMGDHQQQLDNRTVIEHNEPHCASQQVYKGILDGHSRGVFNGKLVVQPKAQLTSARQLNNNLLLSREAEINSKPQLEINADEVKCSHGATSGQLDKNQLFYLVSRGISEVKARDLLIYGFARELLEKTGIPFLQNYLKKCLTRKLPGASRIKEIIQ